MSRQISRRKVLASAGTLVAGGTAAGIATQGANAQLDTSINGLSVPNESIETNTPIKTLTLSVDASYSYETSVVPDSLVLRLQAKTGSEYRQIDATEPPVDGTSDSSSVALNGSLLTLSGLETIVPSERGTTNTESLDVRLVLTARYDGREIGSANTSETVEIAATRSSVSIGMSIGGSGDISAVTETPTN